MQALYSYFQHDKGDVQLFEKELFNSLDKMYDLYISILALLLDIHHTAHVVIDENKHKRLPKPEDLDPNLRFVQNRLLVGMSNNLALKKQIEQRKISWQNEFDLIRKLFNDIRAGEAYKQYMSNPNHTDKDDRAFLIQLITEFLGDHPTLTSLFEDKNIHWADDTFVAFNSVIRTFEGFNGTFELLPLLKDAADDKSFMTVLFKKTIVYNEHHEALINEYTKNWEMDRIASMDMLLMKMAISEFLYIDSVPVKASLNEYIEISKEYSTPNSKVFINGVLDKIIARLKADDRIHKVGKGAKED
ncbi:MAG: transcription antitermination protein NusB [Sediminibacterium sp.]|nr:transcription antitermination protein NusB [Sediminibacterium sp.]